jgi:hypothetical protein
LAVTLLWTLARQPNVLFGLGISLVGIAAAIVGRSQDRRWLRWSVATGLIVISAIGLFEIHHNQAIARTNVGSIIQMRILPDRQWTQWFVAHGMPYPASIAEYRGQPFHYFRQQNPAYFAWIDAHGQSTYVKFVLSHPIYALVDPLPYFSGEEASLHHPNTSVFGGLQPNPTPSILSPTVNYGRHREVLPSVVKNLLFDQGQFGDVLTLAVIAIGLAVFTTRRWGLDNRLLVPAVVVALVVPEGYILWLSGGEAVGELDRLSMVTAVSVRIGLWILLAVGVDRWVAARRPSDSFSPLP